MRPRLTFLLLGAYLLLFPATGWSLVIETGPPVKRIIAGYLVNENEQQITVRVKTADGKEQVLAFDRASIKIIHQIDRLRLEKLNKDNAGAYQDYADELVAAALSEKTRVDPEAMPLALRLYLIAAHLDSSGRGRACLLKMSDVTNRPAEARRLRAMAFLLDPRGDQAPAMDKASKLDPAARLALEAFRKALQYYRNGDINEAIKKAQVEGVAQYFTTAPGIMDQKSFIQACKDAACPQCKSWRTKCSMCKGSKVVAVGFTFQPCTACNGTGKCSACNGTGLEKNYLEDSLESILTAEVWALEQLLPGSRNTKGSWGSALHNQSPVRLLTLETVTDHDPRQYVFRNGTWKVP